jgi:hypothetical protein
MSDLQFFVALQSALRLGVVYNFVMPEMGGTTIQCVQLC